MKYAIITHKKAKTKYMKPMKNYLFSVIVCMTLIWLIEVIASF
jgi:hypothetical protein